MTLIRSFFKKYLTKKVKNKLRLLSHLFKCRINLIIFYLKKILSKQCLESLVNYAKFNNRLPSLALNEPILYRPLLDNKSIINIEPCNSKPRVYGDPALWRRMTATPKYGMSCYVSELKSVYISDIGRVFSKDWHSCVSSWHRRDFQLKHILNNYIYGVQVCSKPIVFDKIKTVNCVISLTQSTSSLYGHFLIEVLTRISLIKDSIKDDSVLYVNISYPVFLEALELIGIKKSQILDAGMQPLIFAKKAIIPTYQAYDGTYFPEHSVKIWRFIRDKAIISNLSNLSKHNKRIYISRNEAGSRQLINSKEVERFIKSYGFVIVRPETMSFNEQVSTFFYADYIIGEHGSGMFNAIFCKDEAVVFDLFPASVNTTLYRALKSLDIKYIAIQSPEGSMARWSANNSFRVNINFIEKAFNDNGVYANPL